MMETKRLEDDDLLRRVEAAREAVEIAVHDDEAAWAQCFADYCELLDEVERRGLEGRVMTWQ